MSRVSLLSDLLGSIGARSWLGGDARPHHLDLPDLAELCHKLVSSQGEATGVRLAAEILEAFRALNDGEAEAFFLMLADEFSPNADALSEAIEAYRAEPGRRTLEDLQEIAEPPRQELFRRLNLAAGGTAELVRMRERLLPLAKSDDERFATVDGDLRHLFQSWFNRGFLVLKPIDWDTPASILERIIRYEAVHAIGDWDQLRQRLAPSDRRCFAFFHPSIPDDPLIFVEVALTRDVPAAIATVLDAKRRILSPSDAQTAVFYSISNCHKGLAGISFGSFLIKQVAEDLKETVPNLRNFVTLSPAPTFARWLSGLDDADRAALEPLERKTLEIVAQDGWANDPAEADEARIGMLALAARYFLRARRPGRETGRSGGPLPSRQWRDARPDHALRRHVGDGSIERTRPDGQLSLRTAAGRTAPRSLCRRRRGRSEPTGDRPAAGPRAQAGLRDQGRSQGCPDRGPSGQDGPRPNGPAPKGRSRHHIEARRALSGKGKRGRDSQPIEGTPMTNPLFDALLSVARTDPGRRLATLPDGRHFSYGDAEATTARLANVLAELGVTPGDRVAVQVEKSIEALFLYLATVRAGAVFLPLNTAYTPAEIEYFLTDAAPRVFVCDPARRDSLAATAEKAGAIVETLGVASGMDAPAGSLVEKAGAAKAEFATVERNPQDLAAILYTSGHDRALEGGHAHPRQPPVECADARRSVAFHGNGRAAARPADLPHPRPLRRL